VAAVEAERASFGSTAPRVAKANKLKEKMTKEIKIIRELARNRLREVKALDQLQTILPDKTWISAIKIEGGKITMDGYALNESAITELPVVRLGAHALRRGPALLQALPTPVFCQQQGTVILWHRQDAAEARRFAGLIERTAVALPELYGAPPALDALLAAITGGGHIVERVSKTWRFGGGGGPWW
jgi:hypothetical protein